MDLVSDIPILAIDGGGTRCRVACIAQGAPLSIETGSANVSTDFQGGVQEIRQGLEVLRARLGETETEFYGRAGFVGLAGVTGHAITHRLRSELPIARLKIADDRPAALRGALAEAEGVLAHCGTGSFFGAQIAGQLRFVGGWGPVLGDEASAQWIGRAAMNAALASVDGLVDTSDLTQLLLNAHGGAAGLVAFAAQATPAEIGQCAKAVTQADAAGDAVARQVMGQGAAHISTMLTQLGWHPGMAICLTGGIGPFFAPHLPQDMQESVTAPKGTPLDGALSLAQEFAQEGMQ